MGSYAGGGCRTQAQRYTIEDTDFSIFLHKEPIMGKLLLGLALVVVVALALLAVPNAAKTREAAGEKLLAHDVYFQLKDSSDANKQKLVDACKKYLKNHPGVLFFGVGTLASELNRDVNDRDFDVALHIYFQDKASHDKYQEADRHVRFVNENKDTWAKVRVFDSYVEK